MAKIIFVRQWKNGKDVQKLTITLFALFLFL